MSPKGRHIIISPRKWAWLWSCDCFKILPFAVYQRVAVGTWPL